MDRYISIKNSLDKIIDVCLATEIINFEIYKIYDDLRQNLKYYDNIDNFLIANPLVNDNVKKILLHLQTYDNLDLISRVEKLHHLGEYLVMVTNKRFVKEEKKDPDITLDQHIKHWFRKNSRIVFSTDKDIIQAAFITIFLIE